MLLLQWWEGELHRGYLIHKARTLQEDKAVRQQAPTAPLPAYLRQRVKVRDMPFPEVLSQHDGEEGAKGGKRDMDGGKVVVGAAKGDTGEGRGEEGDHIAAHYKVVKVEEEEMAAVVGYVVKDLAPELYIELMTSFHFRAVCVLDPDEENM